MPELVSPEVLCIGETMAMVTPTTSERLRTAQDFHIAAGGAEGNVARHLARLGHRAAWASALGADALGARILDQVGADGVDVSRVRIDPERPTGLYLKDPGHGVLYYRSGSAATTLNAADAEGYGLGAIPIVHVSGITAAISESAAGLVEEVSRRIRDSATLFSFDVNYRAAVWADPAQAPDVLLDLARRSDIVFVGRDEAEGIWGTRTAKDVRALLPDTPHLIVKDGEIGATEFTAEGAEFLATPPVEVVEVVGAGDAFAAGWLDAFLRGEDPRGRLAQGHAIAARALQSTHDL